MRWKKWVAWVLPFLVLAVVIWICRDLILGVWKTLSTRQQDTILSGSTGFLIGIISSMVASYLFSRVQKEVWQTDIRDIAGRLSIMHNDHELLLQSMIPAIGGQFTKSLFAFPPMTSEEIARILSNETDRLYGRHHKRVIVTTAKDAYSIKGLKRLDGDVVVWLLEFHVTWQWLNDSKITKHPLEDFLLVAVANDEALDDFSEEHESEAQKTAQRRSLEDFLQKNIVKATIVNPIDARRRIPPNLVNDVFTIDRVYISYAGNTQTIESSDLRKVPQSQLPVGVYAAWSLPQLDLPLPRGDRLHVEYIGRMYLSAEFGTPNGEICWGYMTFRPSDIVGEQYDLTLTFPSDVALGGQTFSVEVIARESGCQLVHGPLERQPREWTDTRGVHVAQISVPGPLTDLHQLSLKWKGAIATRNGNRVH